ncbi:MAG: ATP-binding protein [Myxococcota bacterium]|nr:ATP-binding protein [Myxococcota bacterium]
MLLTSLSFFILMIVSFKSSAKKNSEKRYVRVWAYVCLSGSIFSASLIVTVLIPGNGSGLLLMRITFSSAVFALLVFFLFILEFVKKEGRNRFLKVGAYIGFLIMIFLFWLTNSIIADVRSTEFAAISPVSGPLTFIYGTYIITIWAMTFYLMRKELLTSSGKHKNQIGYMFLSFFIGAISTTGLMLPSWLKTNSIISMIPGMLFPLMPITITYAIIRHRLWDIRTIIHKTAAWAILSAGLVVPLYLIFRLGAHLIHRLGPGEIAALMSLLFLIGYAYMRALKPRVDHWFQRREYDRRKVLDALAIEMNQLRRKDDVLKQVLSALYSTLYPERVNILLRQEALDRAVSEAQLLGSEWRRFGFTKSGMSSGVASVIPEDPVIQRIMDLGQAVELSQLDVDRRFEDLKERAKVYFDVAKIQVCYPLMQGQSLLGLIHLSEKTNLKAYSREDLEFLEKLGPAAAVGLSNSLLFDKVDQQRRELEAFAASLEVKVEERTLELQAANTAFERANLALEKANAELRDLDRMKSQFFANISHELRTPLTLILGPAGSLLNGALGPLGQRHIDSIEGIRKSALELLKLINDLLDISRMEEARLRVRLDLFDLGTLLNQLVDFSRPLAEAKDIDFVLTTEGDLDLEADPDKLERVFVNLLSNALKFTDPGGRVAVRARRSKDKYLVSVEDTGIGISEEYIDKIFDRFGQVDSSITKRYGGSGIGLALARELTELHRGAISVSSEPGVGSVFTVSIPTNLADQLPPELKERRKGEQDTPERRRESDAGMASWGSELLASAEYRFMEIERAGEGERGESRNLSSIMPQGAFKTGRILLVDDNPEIRKFLNQSLSDRYEVWTSDNGDRAWELLTSQRHDLVISDVAIPGMSGLDLCRKIKQTEQTQDTPVILLTARGETEDRVEGHAAGADKYITKPFEIGELRVVIRSLLSGRSRRLEVGARRYSATLETLLGGMAHELHNACQAVQGAQKATLALASRAVKNRNKPDSQPPEEVEKRLDKMDAISSRALARIATVTNSLKQYTRNQMQMPWQDLHLDELVAREVRLLTSGEEKGVVIDLSLDSNAVVRGPEEEIRQMVLNLVENAIHAVGESGNVQVKTKARSGKVLLSVKDDGCGIPLEKREQIFDPFFTTRDPGKGMGLGLALCKRTVTGLGGTIEVRSEEGKGTAMLVELPNTNFGSTGPPPPVV